MKTEGEHGRTGKRLTLWWYNWRTFRPIWICTGIEQQGSYERY